MPFRTLGLNLHLETASISGEKPSGGNWKLHQRSLREHSQPQRWQEFLEFRYLYGYS